jgi:hypothetical protein
MKKIILISIVMCFGVLCLSSNAIADLILAEGKATGQWFNPDHNGEGFFVEVIESGGSQLLGVAMYTFNELGEQMWITGAVPIDSDDVVVTVPVIQADGPIWGSGYDPADLNTIDFGTITARFTSCNTAMFQVRNNVGLEDVDYPTVRLTGIVGVECVDAPPSNEDGVETGKWVADGVCLFIGEDGKRITPENSTCPDSDSMTLNIQATEFEYNGHGGSCILDASCLREAAIVAETGYFFCINPKGLIEGWFTSKTSVHGNAFQATAGGGQVGKMCSGTWSAAPE